MSTLWDRRFLASTTGRIVELLCRGGRTVEEMARTLGITDNAVRAQLAGLERDGFVQRGSLRPGGRRPAQLYGLTPAAERLLPKPYAPLLRRLLDVLGERLSSEELEAVLREAGRRTGAEYGAARGDARARAERAAELLRELGGVAEVDGNGEHVLVRGYCCPVAAVVSGHPEVCLLVEALLSETIDAPVRQECETGDPPTCVFTVVADAPSRGTPARP